ncbi:uncharacterized protein LOC130680390 isoform X4 [Manis pentadactyla]|uniref:uncharacterized protein LOC130680390 isoform X4 n=1 Tax=Manis pentadactyla TaxID=143292 RepID=UPI00255CFABB|nr:uncharacterized protein LOC130680390 isoform X4 [Manis pentadactyla]
MWVLFAGAATPWPSTSEASEEQPMETTGATENGHEAAPEGESPASTVTGAAAGAGGGNAAPPAGNQNGTEGDQINTSKNEEDAGVRICLHSRANISISISRNADGPKCQLSMQGHRSELGPRQLGTCCEPCGRPGFRPHPLRHPGPDAQDPTVVGNGGALLAGTLTHLLSAAQGSSHLPILGHLPPILPPRGSRSPLRG